MKNHHTELDVRRAANGFIVMPSANYSNGRELISRDDVYVFPTAAALGVWMKAWGDAREAEATAAKEKSGDAAKARA